MDSPQRQAAIGSLEQLLTVSCILAGFAFSGLIALPGIQVKQLAGLAGNIPLADPLLAFCVAYYALFFSTLFFLGVILIILVYQTSNFRITLQKLLRIQAKVSILFSCAIGCLVVSVCSLGLPGKVGITIGVVAGIVVTIGFFVESSQARRAARQETAAEPEPAKQ